MTKLYKLTDVNVRTHGGCQWGEGIEHTANGKGILCDKGWLHAYTHPLLAVLLSPIHVDFNNPKLWEAEGEIRKTDNGLKVGCIRLRTIKQIPLPKVTTEQRVRFAILCAMEVYTSPEWVEWAQNWLSGKDRTVETATKAAKAAVMAADAIWNNTEPVEANVEAVKAAVMVTEVKAAAANAASWAAAGAVGAWVKAGLRAASRATKTEAAKAVARAVRAAAEVEELPLVTLAQNAIQQGDRDEVS